MLTQAVIVVSEPPYEPVSLAQAKEWLRVGEDAEDAIIRSLIKTFRERAENYTHRDFIQRTRCLYLDNWPWHHRYGVKIDLPHPPCVEVDSFKYIDSDGVLQTLATDQYSVHTERTPAYIIPAWQATWPSIRLVPDAIQITYKSGYAPGSPQDEQGYQDSLPEAVKVWMETNLAALFDNRERIVTGTILAELPRSISDGLLDHLVVGTRLF